MNLVLWIIAGLLAAAFAAAGLMKLTQPKAKLAASGMAWTEDFSDGQVKGIGAVEVLGAIGLVLPAATGIATVLTPLAAAGLAVTMVGAAITHLRRGEGSMVPINVVLGGLALFVAVMRFGPNAF
ncbi:MAG TPA: DoxX family protein [Streptomyces sp.]|uniref:DoxX family protein n=1 Tax=Streptomyces sp. TaxID=1931 RepID=UPI002C0F4B70|nr:DoxX family protein [Streptomyces sp.]HWU08252.1 DoxX family protein [Streptomyces sp.]